MVKKSSKKVVKSAKRSIKKPLTLRRVLDGIDTVLVKGGPLAKALWDVMSALRGPDVNSLANKANTTVAIRRRAFPKTASTSGSSGNLGASFGYKEDSGYFAWKTPAAFHHFAQHAKSAANALGLKDKA